MAPIILRLNKVVQEKSDQFYYLKDRWADERDHENFQEYIKAFRGILAGTGFTLLSLTKSFKATLESEGQQIMLVIKARGIDILM